MTQIHCECGSVWELLPEIKPEAAKCPGCGRAPGLVVTEGGAILKCALRDHRHPIRAVAFARDSRLFAAAAGAASSSVAKTQIGSTILWDVGSNEPIATLKWHREAVLSVAFSPRDALMATGSRDGTIAIWDVSRGLWDAVLAIRERSWRASGEGILSLAFSADGQWLVSTGEKESIKVWNTNTWQAERSISANRQGRCQAAFSPCGRFLAAVWQSRGAAVVWDVASWSQYLELRLRSEEDRDDYGLAFSPDGNRLAVLGAGDARIWDIATCQVLTSFRPAKSQAIAWSPSGKLIATGGSETSGNATVRLWDADTAAEIDQLAGSRSPATAVAFSPDSRYLISGCQDATVNLWAMAVEPNQVLSRFAAG